MRRRAMAAICSTLLIATPLVSQEATAPPAVNREPSLVLPVGAVGRLALAHELFASAGDRRDGVAAVAAARIAAQVALLDRDRPPSLSPAASAAETALPMPLAANAMIAVARSYGAGDESILTLADQAENEGTGGTIGGVTRSTALLAPGQEAVWSLPFLGGALAEVSVITATTAAIDLAVADEAGQTLCIRPGPVIASYCGWVPASNAPVTITVRNAGSTDIGFWLLTD
jgi:hypothetical protein